MAEWAFSCAECCKDPCECSPVIVAFNVHKLDEQPLRIVPAKAGDPKPQPIVNTAVEALVELMHPGIGENDTMGAPYSFDRELLRDFAANLIRAGVIRGDVGL